MITTHIGEMIRQHAHELLGRAETKRLLDGLNDTHPKLLEELVPKLLTLGEVQRVALEQLAAGARLDPRYGLDSGGAGRNGAREQEYGGAWWRPRGTRLAGG